MGNTTWVGLASLAKPSSGQPPHIFVCFAFYTGVPFPFCVHVLTLLFWEQSCPIDSYLEWLGVAGKAHGQGLEYGLVRRPTQCYCVDSFFPYPVPYTQFVPFFGHLVKCQAGGRPRQWLSSAWAVDPKINWAWARATISLTPQLICI